MSSILSCALGVVVLNGILYVLGGWRGQTGVAYCEELDMEHKKWNSICKMIVGECPESGRWEVVVFWPSQSN